MSALDRLLAQRQKTLADRLAGDGASAILICSSKLAWWLTGLRHCDSAILHADGSLILTPSPSDLTKCNLPRLGIAGNPSVAHLVALHGSGIGELRDGSDYFASARRSKDIFEIEMLTRAANITVKGFRTAAAHLDSSEARFVAELLLALGHFGGEAWAYDPSVASGVAAAQIWSAPRNDVFMRDQPFSVIDAAAMVNGYKADCTVTVLRTSDPNYGAGVGALREVMRNLCAAITSGDRECSQLARSADSLMRQRGLSPLPHALGHGLGLELHEHPHLSRSSTHQLSPGDVFTLEPGFYDPVTGGARLESIYRIDEHGQLICLLDAVALSDELTDSERNHEI